MIQRAWVSFSRLVVGCALTIGGTSLGHAAAIAYIECGGNPLTYLTGYGNTVTTVSESGLTLSSLTGYNAVVAASNCVFANPTNIGNVLADFADAGGRVVLTEFDFQGMWALGGRIMTHGYSPFTVDPSSSGYVNNSFLGTVFNPGSSLFNGFTAANLQTYHQGLVGLDPGANLVADWSSGRHALAYNATGSVVGLNTFITLVWNEQKLLLENAIVGSLTSVPEPGTLLLLSAGLIGASFARRRTAQ